MRRFIAFIVRKVPRPWLIRLSGIFSALMVVFYKGNRYQCPVCQGKFKRFLPYGNTGAANRLCPSCLSLERHRLLWLYLHNRTNFFSAPLKVLHVAPEQPFIRRFRALKNLDYTTADLVSPLADVKMDIMQMPLPNDTFDVVICNHVLEHVSDDRIAMQEILRVLRPGGWAILQVPVDWNRDYTLEDSSITSPAEREKYFGQYDHLRYHGTDYPDRLHEAGFDVDQEDYLASFTHEERDYYRLSPREMIWKSTKPLN